MRTEEYEDGRRHFKPEQIIHMLREAEIKLAGGQTTGEVCWGLGISDEDEEPDWDTQLNLSDDFYHDTWMYREAPEKLAYELLHGLDLGPKLAGPDAVGELRLEHGYTMVSSYWNVEAADEITLSLLQERLNALGTGVRVVMA